MRVESQQLKAFLLETHLITEKKFEKAVKEADESGRKIGDILVAENVVSYEQLLQVEAYILGIPFVNLEKEKVEPDVLKIIPEPIARTHNIVAFRRKGNNLEVAMLDPEDLQTIDFIRKKIDLRILPRLTTPASIKNILLQYQKTLKAEFGDIIQKEAVEIRTIREGEGGVTAEKEELQKVAEDLPVIRIVDMLIRHAVLERASDIHIEPTEKEVVVRYRIDGILRDAMILPKQVHSGVVARIKVLSNLKLDEHRLPQDGRFKVETEDYKYSLRVSILPVFDGEKIVMRLLPETSQAVSLETLGIRNEALEAIQHNLRKPVGMFLVTGPTGSGKTTTLYSLLEILNMPGVNISTVEDPIEYRIPRINQTQVNPKIGLTFANGLRALLRQDPNMIMVGEIRDNETAGLAINAALTGHLVLSTLHTNNAAGAIPRLIDMKAEPFLIASTLNVIVAQRLVRRLYENKAQYRLSAAELKDIEKYCDAEKILDILRKDKIVPAKAAWKDIFFYRPKRSKDCPEGYRGRIGIYEVLNITETIKALIVRGATSDEIHAQAVNDGMKTMIEDGFIKAAQAVTSIEEVLRVTIE